MRSTLGGSHCMDFVDDDRVDIREGVARRRCEHEIEALWRSDEDVGRVTQHALAITSTRVAGAHGDQWFAEIDTHSLSGVSNADDWSSKIFLYVKRKRAER